MSEQLPEFRAAAVQASPVFLDREATLDKTIGLIREAASKGANLVVFPETWVPGYPFWYMYVSRWQYAPGKRAYARLYKNAVDVPGPFTEALGKVAKQEGIYIAIGVNERVTSGTMYNTIVFIGRDGSLLGKHRKLVPTFHERMVWAHGDGSTLDVFNTGIGNLGGLICWEHWMPLTRHALYCQGMQICASVWPQANPMALIACQNLAHEGRCFVIVSCSYLTLSHIPENFELKQEIESVPEVIFNGGSAIIGPDGKYLAEPVYDLETIVYADINRERIIEEKQSFDVIGHYARPEVFKLTVNRQAFSTFQTINEAVDLDLTP